MRLPAGDGDHRFRHSRRRVRDQADPEQLRSSVRLADHQPVRRRTAPQLGTAHHRPLPPFLRRRLRKALLQPEACGGGRRLRGPHQDRIHRRKRQDRRYGDLRRRGASDSGILNLRLQGRDGLRGRQVPSPLPRSRGQALPCRRGSRNAGCRQGLRQQGAADLDRKGRSD